MLTPPRPGLAATSLACAVALCASVGACSEPAAPGATKAAAPVASGAPTLLAAEQRPIVLRGAERQVVRLAGDEDKTLELVVNGGDVKDGSTVRAVPVQAALAADTPYASFTGPVSVELSSRALRPVALRARAASPEAVPVLWRRGSAGWVLRAVGAPGDFAASQEVEGGTFDAGSFLPAAWGASAGARVSAREKIKVKPPVCATQTPVWVTSPAFPEDVPACFGSVQNEKGEPRLQVRVVNAAPLSVVAGLPDGAGDVSVDGQTQVTADALKAYLADEAAVVVPPGGQLTFTVPQDGQAGTLGVPVAVTPRSLLLDVAAAAVAPLADLPPGEAWAAAAPLAARCAASDPAAVAELPEGLALLATRVNGMTTCLARAVAGPGARDQAGLEIAAGRLGRPAQELAGDKGAQEAIARDRGIVRLLGELGVRGAGLGQGATPLASAAAAGSGGRVTAVLDPAKALCDGAQGCSVLAMRPDLDGDGKPDSVAFVTGRAQGQATRYEVRVQTGDGKRSAQAFDADRTVGAAGVLGASAVDGEPGQELLVRMPTADGSGFVYLVLTVRSGVLTAMPTPQENGAPVVLQVLTAPDQVIGWTATSRNGRPALAREIWVPAGSHWQGRIRYWTWTGSGWSDAGEQEAGRRTAADARSRGGFFASGVPSR